ncbi:glycerophosphoryl diester phosphodiesterase [Saonia flava]|uniref:Glycerophosphoryl diester phosphodiesterase n=1 Tax=Saonia flava TaxID=523696 RepID=A0A846QP29_9FLAO|nr:interleukin-like EMT inducer domain-containing protein [Saonia flava]NJB69831.1 glycerophosphoryl diester phosphodiesterase [Saonia flava]
MKRNKLFTIHATLILCLVLVVFVGFTTTAFAKTNENVLLIKNMETPTVVLNSFSFNAKKKSNFIVNGQKEPIDRGLTIIHFQSNGKFEFRTFDTYGSEEDSQKLIEALVSMQKNKSVFAILAHDSANKSLVGQSEKLAQMGFVKLSTIASRQAYVMHNLDGVITESIDDVSITQSQMVPSNILDSQVYFPRIKYEFEPNNNRYIAHAGGEVNGVKSTNTKDALDQNYAKGFRLFELDIIETSDGKLVAAHDWNMWSRFTDYGGTLPPTHAEFLKHKIYGDYTTLDMEGINKWFKTHPDATLVTDKVNDPVAFANSFVDKNRLIMELFSVMAVEEATRNGIHAMISHKPFLGMDGDKLNFLEVNNVKYVALSRRAIKRETKLLLQLKEHGIKVYVYHVNFDEGRDEEYVQENEIGLVYGMYADKWVFDPVKEKQSK